MTERIGLEAIWDNANFNKGNADYLSKMAQANTQTATTSTGINQLGASTQSAGGLFANLAGMLGISTGQMFTLAGAIGVGVGAFKLISSAVSEFVGFMLQGEDSAVKLASRVQELNLAAQAMGQFVGMDGEQVQALVKGLTDMEISGKDANQVVADFARYGLNMAQVLDLATVAENASILTGKSATETFADLSTGIQRMMVRQLKSSGIVMNASDAYQKYADILGKDKDALTETEQQQAFLNEVIAKGAKLQGLHAVAMQTAAEQMDHFTAKVIPDLKTAMGAPFQAAYYNVIKGISDLVTEFTKLISEGGALYPVLINLGAIFKLITEPLLGMGDALADFSTNKLTGFAGSIMQTIDNAFTWGENLVINFANGIIEAASTVLVGAINFMSGLLTFWMAPGSPPKFIPNIDKWGSEAMEEYLKGFTEADFSVLSDLQSPIEQVLGSLADMGTITKQAASQLYVSLSEGMIQALSSGGLTNDLLAQLMAAGGMYGDELVDLAKKEFALSDAEKAVTENEKALNDAKKKAVDMGAKVNVGLMEYNQMLRGGASKQALIAKLAEINANKKAQAEATKDIDAKQTALDLAKEQLIATQDQVKAIKDMLKVMLDLNKAQIAAVTPPTEAAAKAGAAEAGVTPAGETPTFDPSKISNAFTLAVDKAANEMKNKLSLKWIETTQAIKLAWDTMMVNLWVAWYKSGLDHVWDNIKIEAGKAWEWIKGEAASVLKILTGWWKTYGGDVTIIWNTIVSVVSGVITWILTLIGKMLPGIVQIFQGIWEVVKNVFGLVLNFIGAVLSTIVAFFQKDKDRLHQIWNDFGKNVLGFMQGIWDGIINIAIGIAKAFEQLVMAIFNTIVAGFTAVWNWLFGASFFPDLLAGIITFAANFIQSIVDWMIGVWDNIVEIADKIGEAWTTFWDAISTKVTDIWNAIKKWISDKFGEIKTWISTTSGEIKVAWDTFWGDVSKKVSDTWDAIVKGIGEKVQAVKDAIAAMFTDPTTGIFARFAGWITDMVQSGKDLIGGLVTGVTSAAQGLIDTVVQAVKDAITAAKEFLHIPQSPSGLQLMNLYGKEIMKELQVGIEANVNYPAKAMRNAMVQTLAPAASVPVTMGATNNYYQPNINIPTTINSGMNVPQFQALIMRTVRKGMKV